MNQHMIKNMLQKSSPVKEIEYGKNVYENANFVKKIIRFFKSFPNFFSINALFYVNFVNLLVFSNSDKIVQIRNTKYQSILFISFHLR